MEDMPSRIIPRKPVDTSSCKTCEVCGENVEQRLTEESAAILNSFGGSFSAGDIIPHECRCKRELRERRERVEREASFNARKIERLRRKGIADELISEMRFENDRGFNPDTAKKAQRYVDNWDEMKSGNVGLIFTGGVGTGKTFFAGCIANELIDQGIFVLMTSLSKIIGCGFDEYDDVLRDITRADLVIFDDVGAERDTSFASERAFDAVDARVKARRPIIVTTNLSPAEMSNTAGIREKRIYDRLLGSCAIITVTGPSIREIEQREKTKRLRALLEGEA